MKTKSFWPFTNEWMNEFMSAGLREYLYIALFWFFVLYKIVTFFLKNAIYFLFFELSLGASDKNILFSNTFLNQWGLNICQIAYQNCVNITFDWSILRGPTKA